MHHLRKTTRLPYYDYANSGIYFVTICAANRANLFGTLIEGEVFLNDIGERVVHAWKDIPSHHHDVILDEYIVMPNHLHAILILTSRNTSPDLDKAGLVPTIRFGHPGVGSLSSIIGSFKSASARQIRKLYPHMTSIWQSRFIEHVIRDEDDLYHHRRYVHENPARWLTKRNHLL